jgi:hypothetical protein
LRLPISFTCSPCFYGRFCVAGPFAEPTTFWEAGKLNEIKSLIDLKNLGNSLNRLYGVNAGLVAHDCGSLHGVLPAGFALAPAGHACQ